MLTIFQIYNLKKIQHNLKQLNMSIAAKLQIIEEKISKLEQENVEIKSKLKNETTVKLLFSII